MDFACLIIIVFPFLFLVLGDDVSRTCWPWAVEDAVGSRGIDCCGGAFGAVMVEKKRRLVMGSAGSMHTPAQRWVPLFIVR